MGEEAICTVQKSRLHRDAEKRKGRFHHFNLCFFPAFTPLDMDILSQNR
jgi:hypothetical protein